MAWSPGRLGRGGGPLGLAGDGGRLKNKHNRGEEQPFHNKAPVNREVTELFTPQPANAVLILFKYISAKKQY